METLHEKPLCRDCPSCGFDLVSLSELDFILVGGILMFTHRNHQSSVGKKRILNRNSTALPSGNSTGIE